MIRKILETDIAAETFLDDIVIHSKEPMQHLLDLKRVIGKLQSVGLSLNFEKCKFAQSKITYLGKVVSKEGIRVDKSRIEKFVYKTSKTRKDVQRLVGLINWFRLFIYKLSHKLHSITECLKMKKGLNWTQEQEEQVALLFEEIRKDTLLHFPIQGEKFVLQTDASEYALGSVLYQMGKVIGFFSRKLTDTEYHYTIQEKEALSVVNSLEYFRTIILGSEIVVKCDNRNLLFQKDDLRQKTQRWQLLVAEYNCTFERIDGKDNHTADYLSRCWSTFSDENEVWNIKEISEQQKADRLCQRLQESAKLSIKKINGVETLVDSKERLYLTPGQHEKLVKRIHLEFGHWGQQRLTKPSRDFGPVTNLMIRLKE